MGSLPEGVTIREGGYYRQRNGETVGPAEFRPDSSGDTMPWHVGGRGGPWRAPDGRWNYTSRSEHQLDLVAEVENPYVIESSIVGERLQRVAEAILLPTDSQARKDTPVYSGVMAYFPLALAEVAKLSKAGNDKHNPGQPLHWSRGKSNDHADCIARHLLEIGTRDPDDGHLHSTKLAWRALANLQIELENLAKGGAVSS